MMSRAQIPVALQSAGSGWLLLVLVLLPFTPSAAVRADEPAARAPTLGGIPLHFEANRGQLASEVEFLARGPGYSVWLSRGEAWIGLARGHDAPAVVRMRLVGSRSDALGEAEQQLPGVVNVFRGSDPVGWHTGIPTYGRVRYRDLLPGVDQVFYGTPEKLEHDLVVAPGVDPAGLALEFDALEVDGLEALSLTSHGELDLHLAGGVFRLKRPVAYQPVVSATGDAGRESVEARYLLREGQRVAFAIGAYDRSRPLVIDPVIEYSTYYGGSAAEIGYDIAVGADRTAYITGTTTSSNLPTTTGAFDEVGRVGGFFDPGDAFVARFSDDGEQLLWATYLSGRELDRLFGIALDESANVYVVGDSDSTDDLGTGGVDESYPQVNAAQSGFGGVSDLVVTKLDPTGSAIVFSTFLGGNDADRADTELDKPSIAVDSLGRAVVSAVTQSTDFHTVAGCNLSSPGPYVVRYTAAGTSLDGCVGVGGDAFVFLRDLVIDASNRPMVIGFTADLNVVTTAGTFSTTPLMGEDIIISRMNAAMTAVQAGTYFGDTDDDFGNGLALDPQGNVYLTGRSSSAGYPITIGGAPGGNGVLTKLDPALATVVWSRALGFFEGLAVAVDALGRSSAVGTDNQDAAFAHIGATGFQEFETFWGGLFPDFANSVALDEAGHAYVTGETRSSGFPGDTVENTNPFQASLSGNADAWVLKLRRDDPILPQVPLTPLAAAAARRGSRGPGSPPSPPAPVLTPCPAPDSHPSGGLHRIATNRLGAPKPLGCQGPATKRDPRQDGLVWVPGTRFLPVLGGRPLRGEEGGFASRRLSRRSPRRRAVQSEERGEGEWGRVGPGSGAKRTKSPDALVATSGAEFVGQPTAKKSQALSCAEAPSIWGAPDTRSSAAAGRAAEESARATIPPRIRLE